MRDEREFGHGRERGFGGRGFGGHAFRERFFRDSGFAEWAFAGRGRSGPGGEGRGEGWSDRRGGRGPRGRMFASGELRLLLIHLIGEAPRHGYELIKAVEELTAGEYAPSPGVVYPTLQLLADEGAIAEADGAEPRRAFALTEAGEKELADRRDEADAIVARLKALGEHESRTAVPQLMRAMGNLALVLRHRAREGGIDKETLDRIVDLIDETARTIERL